MKRFLVGLACAAFAAVSPAIAGTTNIGDLYGGSGFYTNVSWNGDAPVTDLYNFELSSDSVVHASATDTFGIGDLMGMLYKDGAEAPMMTFGPYNDGDLGNTIQFGQLSAGSYHLTMTGTPDFIGAYSLTLRSDIAPAPVPGPAGLLVAAAGAAAVALRRRKAAKTLAI